ncbi:MAG TPA: hypothetical protein VIX84_19785 [Acidimicrobiales bacterium]
MARLRTRRARIVTVIIVVVVAFFVAATLRLFVLPDVNAPARADAIIVLGGNGAGPEDRGIRLAEEGYATTLVFSLVPSQTCAHSAITKITVVCFRGDPQTTLSESRSIAALAHRHHWNRILVVMPTTQASRAQLRIRRCYSGQVLEVGVPDPGFWAWMRGIAYEWAALLKALVLQPSC